MGHHFQDPYCYRVSSKFYIHSSRGLFYRAMWGHRADFRATGTSGLGRDRAHYIGMMGFRVNSLEDLQKPLHLQEIDSPGAHPTSTKDTT